ncbi:MAG: cell division protein SepF [Agathobacter sp.]|nr:cell division protein SepF [Agathobacter sp.]
MSLMDKFLDVMRLNGDDDDDDYEFANEDFYDDDDYEEPKRKTARRESRVEPKEEPKKPISKITPIGKTQKKQVANTGMEVCVIKPTTIEDEIEIVDTLLSGRTVLINMEGLNLEIAQRIIDFTSGATYAMHGSLQKVSNYIFLATPNGVDISGDIQNLMDTFDSGNSFTF